MPEKRQRHAREPAGEEQTVKSRYSGRILVVDEERSTIEFMKRFLNELGYHAEGVIGGEKAFEEVQKHHPDLVITEIMTSGIDGFELTRRLRAERATRTLPIMLITAQKSKSARMRAIESGADEYITKPADKEEVAKRIHSLLELNFYRSLVDEKRKLDTVIDGMSDAILILEPDLTLSRYNSEARKLLGLRKKPPKGFRLLEHLSESFKLSFDRRKVEQGKRKIEQFRMVRPETDRMKALYLSGKATYLKDPLGNTSSIVITLRDVTERVREDLQKEAFLSSISHKLRTPATVLTGMLRLLNDENFGHLTEHQKNFLEKIFESASTIYSLIEKLIAFNALTRKELMMEGKHISLSEFFRDFEGRIRENYALRKFTLKLQDLSHLPPCFFNPLQMEMIFWHLIDNAIKFNDKKRPLVKLSARLVTKKKIEVAISDNGPGIPPENHELIFTGFYQYERIYTGNVEGLGLGLAMARKILEGWGQKISFDSTIGKGTVFRFTLPTVEPPAPL
ncbi:MAG: response regulator [Candidatus Eremiobacteraeota bacterium]|nr:response regulator [Candidatus Eremiobacteraeota bacterium]